MNTVSLLLKLHFWVTFIGVNLTFFPNAFLRSGWHAEKVYVDYPDAFAGWNMVASIGSYIGAARCSDFLGSYY